MKSTSNFKIAETKNTLSRHSRYCVNKRVRRFEMDNFILFLGVTHVSIIVINYYKMQSGRNTVLTEFSSDLRFASQSPPANFKVAKRRSVFRLNQFSNRNMSDSSISSELILQEMQEDVRYTLFQKYWQASHFQRNFPYSIRW